MMSKQMGIDALYVAAAMQTSSQGAHAAGAIVREMISLQYSREDEKHADIYGLDYMARAGYDPNGMVETMKMLEKEDEVRPCEFFSTHPSPENRIVHIQAKIHTSYFNAAGGTKVGKEDYQLFVLDKLKATPDSEGTETVNEIKTQPGTNP
jgi:predicted Zn-dependent protease